MQRADSLEKTLLLGKIEGRRRRGRQRMRWLDDITDSMDMSLSKLWERAKDKEAGILQSVRACVLSRFSRIWLPATPWSMTRQGQARIQEWVGVSFSKSDHGVAKSRTWLNDWTERHVFIHCYSISQRIFTAWKILSAWPIHPSSYQPLETNDDFTVSVVLPFLGCHILEWYGMYSLSDWLISVSNMHLRFLHVFSWLNSSFLLKAE